MDSNRIVNVALEIPAHSDQALADQLIQLVSQLADELHPDLSASYRITSNSRLDSDLGFDSLSRVELINRIEQHFVINLPENTLSTAETVQDLLKCVSQGQQKGHNLDKQVLTGQTTTLVDELPDREETLIQVLNWHLENHPDRPHIEMYQDAGHGLQINYGQLAANSYRVAWGISDLSISRGARVTLMLPTSAEYFYSFMGVLAAGAVPVPIYPPTRLSQIESYIRRHRTILNNCQAELMITTPEVIRYAPLLKSLAPSIKHIVSVQDFSHYSHKPLKLNISPDDIAFIQYTSGSTAAPKGVQLTHANLLANIRAMGKVTRLTSQDLFVSWLPLYHDMGLIGAWLGTFYHAARLVVMSPLAFLTRPQRWLWAIHRHRATISAAPNFAYDLCVHRLKEQELTGLDLSNWRIACNGAEPVVPETVRSFCDRFAQFGFHKESYWPVYGLAESSVGLAFPQANTRPFIQRVDRKIFTQKGRVEPVSENKANALEFVACGEVLPGHQIRIVDDLDIELPEKQQGRLQFKGPSSTSGYFRNPDQTKKLFHDDWLDSGDLAYMFQGQIFLTGRTKDIIIRAGRNIYPHEIEDAVGAVAGVRRGRVVAFGVQSNNTEKEKLIILAETREKDLEKHRQIRQQVLLACTEIVDLPPDEILLAPPNTILKTSSGKLRRSACKSLYEKNRVGAKPPPVWWQLTKIGVAGLGVQLKKTSRLLASVAYAIYCWLICGLVTLFYCPVILVIPKEKQRFRFSANITKLLFKLTATKLTIKGLDKIPNDRPVIYVANHCSYVDAFCLVAALPYNYRFVAKMELSINPLFKQILRRLNVEFVERFDRVKSVASTAQLMKVSESLFFFPEGTFTRKPGLANFHMGAFLVAANNKFPVVPVTIQGTRSILRAGSWFPRRGQVNIDIGNLINSSDGIDTWPAATQLKNQARKAILANCSEPDLEGLE